VHIEVKGGADVGVAKEYADFMDEVLNMKQIFTHYSLSNLFDGIIANS
jgi:hypothetical protein